MGTIIYTFAFIGGITTLMFAIGMVRTVFSLEHTDYVEQALEEVTKRGKRK